MVADWRIEAAYYKFLVHVEGVPDFFFARAHPEPLYNLCLILKSML
jgi:hypothetical protein